MTSGMRESAARVAYLADHPEAVPLFKSWLEREWPAWYGPGGRGDAGTDLARYSNCESLPVGFLAYYRDEPCGLAALKSEAITGHEHLQPWAGAAFVLPRLRNRGIGSMLLHALETEARNLGYEHIYCGTIRAANLLLRSGWREIGRVRHDGEDVSVYEKALTSVQP